MFFFLRHDKSIVRIKPSMLVRVLSSLSDDQKSWISSTGFDSIISFELNEYPVKLSEYLLSSFEPNLSVLRINQKKIEIAVEDVGAVDVGIDESIYLRKSWAEDFGRTKQYYQVTPI